MDGETKALLSYAIIGIILIYGVYKRLTTLDSPEFRLGIRVTSTIFLATGAGLVFVWYNKLSGSPSLDIGSTTKYWYVWPSLAIGVYLFAYKGSKYAVYPQMIYAIPAVFIIEIFAQGNVSVYIIFMVSIFLLSTFVIGAMVVAIGPIVAAYALAKLVGNALFDKPLGKIPWSDLLDLVGLPPPWQVAIILAGAILGVADIFKFYGGYGSLRSLDDWISEKFS